MKKEIYILVGLILVFNLALVLWAQAGTLTTVTVTPSTSQGGISGNYTISFVVASSTEIESQIRLIFPAGFDVSGATATSTAPSSTGAAIIASSTVSGQEVTLWLADGSVTPAGETIQVQADAIKSPYPGGSFTLGVQTRTLANGAIDSASSTAFTIDENLTLEQVTITPTSSEGGYVSNYTVSFVVASSTEIESQIRLIFPAGFDVAGATATSTITASSTGSAIVASSTVSGQEITIWLADGSVTAASETIEIASIPNIQSPYLGGSFTLGIETRTLADTLSNSASSTSFSIVASRNTGQTGAGPTDKTRPTSLITDPASALTLTEGEEYVIKGISTDAGGSSVNKVEVSVDDGKTWSAADNTGYYGSSFEWKYVWKDTTAGDYTIRARGTDSVGNRETLSAGVKATVTAAAVSPTPSPTPTPAGETTVEALQSQIATLQQQVITLMQQLIALLMAQL